MTFTDETVKPIGIAIATLNFFMDKRMMNRTGVYPFIEGLLVRLVKDTNIADRFVGFELGLSTRELTTEDIELFESFDVDSLLELIGDKEAFAKFLTEYSEEFNAAYIEKNGVDPALIMDVDVSKMVANYIFEKTTLSQLEASIEANKDRWILSQHHSAVTVDTDNQFTLYAILDNGSNPNIHFVLQEKSADTTYVFHSIQWPLVEDPEGTPRIERVLVPTSNMLEFLSENPNIFDGLRKLDGFASAGRVITDLNAQVAQMQVVSTGLTLS